MVISRYSSYRTFNPSMIFHAVLDSENLHPYLRTIDISRVSQINKVAYRFLCFHLHAEHNIFNIHRHLSLSLTQLEEIKNFYNSQKANFGNGSFITKIWMKNLAGSLNTFKIAVCKTSQIFESYIFIPKCHPGGGYKHVEYCMDLNTYEMFVYLRGKKAIEKSEIAIMDQFQNNRRLSTYHRMLIFDDGVGLIVPFCNAGDLSQFIQARLDLPTLFQREWSQLFALELSSEISLAIAPLHFVKITHCDIKPPNILLNFRGTKLEVKITDFGKSISFGEENRGGTLEYYSPELCKSLLSRVRPKTHSDFDIYALGLVLSIIMTQRYPKFMFEARKDSESESSFHYRKLHAIASFSNNTTLQDQIFQSPLNPHGLMPSSPIGHLVRDMVCSPPPRINIDQVIDRINASKTA